VRGEALVAAQQRAGSRLTELLTPLCEAYPGIEVTEDVVNHGAAGTLVDATVGAELMVLATHRAPGEHSHTLGSVVNAVLHHGHSAVLLIPVG
jgi:nucleotide-binding universal stress UspA family protein